MKKVLILSLAYFPKHVGGAEVAVKEITDRLGYEIEFHMVTMRFSADEKNEEKIGNVHVHRIGLGSSRVQKFLFQFSAFRKASKLHVEHHFDAIWALMAHSAGVPAGLFKSRYPEVGYVLNLQEGDSIEHIERTMLPLWPLFTRSFTKADIIQPISNFLAGWAHRRGFMGPIEVIPNGVNAKHFSYPFSEEVLEHQREELGKRSGDFFLVTTSRLVTKNAVDDVIKAMPRLSENIHFIVYGSGPEEEKLKELIGKCGLQKRVHLKGQMSHIDMPKALQACDVFIRPSRSEGMGASFIEAMAAGLPVIATQEGGIADFLFDAQRNPDKPTTGWAVDKDSPEQIAEAVQDILRNPEKTARVVETAKKMVFEKYDWDLIARDMRMNVLEKLFAKRQ